MNKKQKIWQSHLPGVALGASVVKGDIGFAIRFWKKAVKDSGKLFEFKKRKEHIKKSQKRREQLNAAKFAQYLKNKHQD
tara:strand:- start:116 stop:352 length:237 start_codon:yes stop_codon:yes gene_type:complete